MDERLEAARHALAAGEYARGVALARAALAEGPAEVHGEAHLLAGIGWCCAGLWVDAEEHLLQALALSTQRGLALYHLAMCYEHMRRIDTAAVVYEQAAEILATEGQAGHAAYARHNAAWMLLYHGQADKARLLLPTSTAAAAGGDPYELALLETGRSQLATAQDPKLWNLYSQLRLA